MKLFRLLSSRSSVLLWLGVALISANTWAQPPQTIVLTSPAFAHETPIPLKHSAYGDGISPALNWSNLPTGTRQLALIMDDPVAPTPQPFVHWVAYNIPASASGLPEGLTTNAQVSGVPALNGMINGLHGMRRTGYFGPRPPAGTGNTHEYNFRIYALDAELDLPTGLNKQQLLEAIDGHVLATGLLIGHYRQD